MKNNRSVGSFGLVGSPEQLQHLFCIMFSKKYILLRDNDFILIQSKVKDLAMEIEKFRTQLISLRGLVNRKLSKDAGDPGEEELKSPDGLDDLRK